MKKINIKKVKKNLRIQWKKVGFLAFFFLIAFSFVPLKTSVFAQTPPNFEKDFSSYLLDENKSNDGEHWEETVYNMFISRDLSLKDNIKCLFYPSSQVYTIKWVKCSSASGGKIWDFLRYVVVGIVFFFLVLVGVRLLISSPDSDKDKIKQSLKSLYYIAIGTLLFFWAIWIIDVAFNFGWITSSAELAKHVSSWPDSLLFKIIALLKVLVFFIAIVMMVIYWFKIMSAMDKADEAKKHIRGVANVIIALILVKVIDYIYYIAQLKDFTTKASDSIISIAKILGFIIGWGAVLMVFYSWYLLLTDQWSGEKMKQAKNIIVNILLVWLVLALFLLIIYQVFSEFA